MLIHFHYFIQFNIFMELSRLQAECMRKNFEKFVNKL